MFTPNYSNMSENNRYLKKINDLTEKVLEQDRNKITFLKNFFYTSIILSIICLVIFCLTYFFEKYFYIFLSIYIFIYFIFYTTFFILRNTKS